jgi:predicted dehydrogenase
MRLIRDLIRSGELGAIYAAELTFHNAYGPDKDWFYDRARSGGGCVIDLGVHLVDLALWALDFPQVSAVSARLLAGGEPLRADEPRVEDYAAATITLETGATLQLACSWRLQAGQDAIIAAAFYGTAGGAALRNIGGSFYDFTAERYRGTSTETLSAPPDDWGGRAAAEWAQRLAAGKGYDPAADRLVDVARVLDMIYAQ